MPVDNENLHLSLLRSAQIFLYIVLYLEYYRYITKYIFQENISSRELAIKTNSTQ